MVAIAKSIPIYYIRVFNRVVARTACGHNYPNIISPVSRIQAFIEELPRCKITLDNIKKLCIAVWARKPFSGVRYRPLDKFGGLHASHFEFSRYYSLDREGQQCERLRLLRGTDQESEFRATQKRLWLLRLSLRLRNVHSLSRNCRTKSRIHAGGGKKGQQFGITNRLCRRVHMTAALVNNYRRATTSINKV
jgi:hypothetical protein